MALSSSHSEYWPKEKKFNKFYDALSFPLITVWKPINDKLEIRVSAEPREARGVRKGVGGQERNEVNHVTGEGRSNIRSWDVLNLLWIKLEPSALASKRIFWDLNYMELLLLANAA